MARGDHLLVGLHCPIELALPIEGASQVECCPRFSLSGSPLICILSYRSVPKFSMGDFTPLDEALAVKTSATSTSSTAAQHLSDSKPTVMDQIAYSVDRFIPIYMGFEDAFEPHKPWSTAYSLIHVIAGWLLIPLFLASWSGLVRSQR